MDKKTFIISIIGAAAVSLVLGFYSGRYFERMNTARNFQRMRGNLQGRPANGMRRSGSFPGGFVPSGTQPIE
ncbi:MAG: hypothetical protein ABIJ82_01620 [Patescibacteria group bacterium]|nr:hypothetical protein [Patescibacteria group bacterium]MBU1952857.1 hypothetical protein [Patescibacteria group bacterium]